MDFDIEGLEDIVSPYILKFRGSNVVAISKPLVSRLESIGVDNSDFLEQVSSAMLPYEERELISIRNRVGGITKFYCVPVEGNNTRLVVLTDLKSGVGEDLRSSSRDTFRKIIDRSNIASLVMQDGRIIYTNDRFQRLVGYSKEEIIGKPFLKFISREDRAPFVGACARLKHSNAGDVFSINSVLRAYPAKRVNAMITCGRLSGSGYAGLLWAQVENITEKKKLEQKVKELEQKYTEIYSKSLAAMIYLSPRGDIRDCNEFVTKVTGYTREEIINNPFTKFVSPSEVDNLVEEFRALYLEGRKLVGKECELVTKDGKEIIIEYNAQVVTRRRHKVGALMMFTDITEKKLLEQELLSKNQEMEETLWEMAEVKDALEARAGELNRLTERLTVLNEKLNLLSITDGLTEVYNHRYFQERLSEEISRIYRHKEDPVSLLMLDIDDFKKFNDTYGHQCGDMVLKQLARILQDNVRKIDIVSRYGGEEFTVILPKTESRKASLVAKRICKKVAETPFVLDDAGNTGCVTVSIGVGTFRFGDGDKADLIKRADDALYKAKAMGKNRVEVWKKEA